MKENSSGSVIPVKKEAKTAATKRADTAFFLLSLALRYIAKAAPGKPNIMTGKKPAWYIPVLPSSPIPCQKFLISSIPATSNQNTALRAWCKPTGIKRRLKKP